MSNDRGHSYTCTTKGYILVFASPWVILNTKLSCVRTIILRFLNKTFFYINEIISFIQSITGGLTSILGGKKADPTSTAAAAAPAAQSVIFTFSNTHSSKLSFISE